MYELKLRYKESDYGSLEEYIHKTAPNCHIHSSDGYKFRIHKEILIQAPNIRCAINATSAYHCCEDLEIFIPDATKEQLCTMIEFLYTADVEITDPTVLNLLESIFGIQNLSLIPMENNSINADVEMVDKSNNNAKIEASNRPKNQSAIEQHDHIEDHDEIPDLNDEEDHVSGKQLKGYSLATDSDAKSTLFSSDEEDQDATDAIQPAPLPTPAGNKVLLTNPGRSKEAFKCTYDWTLQKMTNLKKIAKKRKRFPPIDPAKIDPPVYPFENEKGFCIREREGKHIFICTDCYKCYSSRQYVKIHISSHDTEGKLHMCQYCDKPFKSEKRLKNHIVLQHDLSVLR